MYMFCFIKNTHTLSLSLSLTIFLNDYMLLKVNFEPTGVCFGREFEIFYSKSLPQNTNNHIITVFSFDL